MVRRYAQFHLRFSGLTKSILAALLMAALVFPVRNFPLFLTLPAAIAVYLATLLVINPEIKSALIRMIKTNNQGGAETE